MDSSSTLVKGAPLKRGDMAVLMAAALHASSTDLKSSSAGSLNRQFLFPERKEPLSPVLVPSSGPSGNEQPKQASNNNNSHDGSESDSDASNSSDDSYDSDDDDEDKSAAAATGDGAALSSRTRAPSWESSTTVATIVEDENASIKIAAAAAAASLNPAASVDVLAEIRKMIKEELGQFRDDKDKKGEEQQKTQGQDTPTQQPPRTRSPPSSQPSPVSKSSYAFPSLQQQQQPVAPGPAASSTPSSPGRQTEARWSDTSISPVVEMSAIDQKWGILFDGQGVGTKRLEQVFKGFARYIAEELTPRKMEVVTPDKVVIFYLHYKLDVEVFPFTAIFSGRGRQAHERVADLYHQLGCEYYLVPAEAQCRPTMPGLTMRGFAQWMTWTIRAYPDEEARRLARAVSALPFNAESLLDGKPERLPKQISRHLLPEKPNQDARARFDDVLKRVVDDMQLSPSSAASATFRGVPLANLSNSSTAQPYSSPRQDASASSNSSTATRRASDSRTSSPRSRYRPRSEVPSSASSASSAASWQTDEDYNNHSRRRSATGTGTGGGTTPRARSGSVRDDMSTGAGYARSMGSASHASNSSAARRDPPSSSRPPPPIVTAASSAASSNSTNARRSRRGSSPPPFGHRHHSLSVGDMLSFPATPSPTAVKFDTSTTAASGRGGDRGRSARDERDRDRDRDRERERERERERDRRGRRPASLVNTFSNTSASGGGGGSSSSSSRRSTSRRRLPPVVIVHDDRDRERDRERDRDRDRERDRDGRGPTWQEYLAGPAAGAASRSGTRVRRPSEARSSTS
ncbi:hypothetical protein B0T26DRAFT_452095 [Lasiosphaeria miniovina]|uniref:DUF7514 domain-containing protein n=1 Tax=Lasiosphaeria miniovina TaxID=1954250 RepID=A0AA39ZZE4_9PEZI|nr:uncharacterized protein B0T26DRAFT_452095 [Lasiosphaeria miniovina]KAK0706394.1 hypothetical protein B0T26DRAFT_452095 [Lasiosphaeria miniovina]